MEEQIAATRLQVEAAIAAGVRTIQLRWKHADAGHFLELARQCVSDQALFIINDRVDVFLAARIRGIPVGGVHIGQTDLPPQLVRDLVGPDAHIGWSAAYPQEIARARELTEVIDSIGVGVIRDTATKPDAPPPLGVDGVAAIAAEFPLPVVAIGGITCADIPALAATQVQCAAVVSAIAAAADPAAAARSLVHVWDERRGGTA